jgi:N-acetylmuramoyl-L-alanine amidase
LFTDLIPRAVSGYAYDRGAQTLRWSGSERDVTGASQAIAPPQQAVAPPPDRPASQEPPAAVPPNSDTQAPRARRPTAPAKAEAPVVVVDAGHGGPDRGMRGPIGSAAKIYEADITLGIARQLQSELRRRGVTVIMTRATDTLIALRDRGRIANRAQGTLFISIHVNAANPRWRQPGGARGFETYFLSEAKTDDERRVEELENEAVKYEAEETFSPADPMSFILNDMKQNEYLRESQDLARTVQQGLASVHPGPNRGVKQAGFRVLVSSFMPSVLVEVGFGSNPTEARYLSSSAGQKEVASALSDAAMKYLEDLERRNAASGGVGR